MEREQGKVNLFNDPLDLHDMTANTSQRHLKSLMCNFNMHFSEKETFFKGLINGRRSSFLQGKLQDKQTCLFQLHPNICNVQFQICN